MLLSQLIEPGMLLTCKSLKPAGELPWHDHGGLPTLCVVYKGSVLEEDAQAVRHRLPGDLHFMPEPEPHRNQACSQGVGIVTLEIEDRAMRGLRAEGLELEGTLSEQSQRAARIAQLVQVALSDPDPASVLELHGLSYQLLSVAARYRHARSVTPPPWLMELMDQLRQDFRVTPTLSLLARDYGVSPYQLSRSFRHYYGSSVGECLRGLRVAHALELLERNELPIAEIALDSGFCDQSHLTNVFKKRTGRTPAAYRRYAQRAAWT